MLEAAGETVNNAVGCESQTLQTNSSFYVLPYLLLPRVPHIREGRSQWTETVEAVKYHVVEAATLPDICTNPCRY